MKGRGMTVIFAITHLIATMACTYILTITARGKPEETLRLIMVFFACTYGLQPVLGIIADAVNRNTLMASTGCVLICLGYFLMRNPLAVAAVCGSGMAAFYVGAGLDVVNTSDRKVYLLAIFLSPDLIGIYHGLIWEKVSDWHYLIPAIVLFVMAVFALFASSLNRRELRSGNAKISWSEFRCGKNLLGLAAMVIVAGIAPVFVVRQIHAGSQAAMLTLVGAICFMVGKIVGGFLADILGADKVASAAVVLTGISSSIYVATDSQALALAAIFFAGMLLPITLWTVSRIFYGTKGFVMGQVTLVWGLSFFCTARSRYEPEPVFLLLASLVCVVLIQFASAQTEERRNAS